MLRSKGNALSLALPPRDAELDSGANPFRQFLAMRCWVGVLASSLIGLLLGTGVDAAVWLFAFASALNGNVFITVPFIVSTSISGDDVIARSGLGLLVVPVCAAALGALIGAMAVRRAKSAVL